MFLETETARINVEVAGPNLAPSIFFWNGAFCNLRQWDYLCEKLKDDFRLIRFDIRGTGKSHAYVDEALEFSLEQYAEDAVLILDTLSVEKCHIWSMAWGSRAAIAFCSIHPDRVLSAALFDASVDAADVERQKNGAREALAKHGIYKALFLSLKRFIRCNPFFKGGVDLVPSQNKKRSA